MTNARRIGYALSFPVALTAAIVENLSEDQRVDAALLLVAFLAIAMMWILSPPSSRRRS
jgi:hypothetical protein